MAAREKVDVPRPGLPPFHKNWPVRFQEWTPEQTAEYHEWSERCREYWLEITGRLSELVPCEGLEFIGSGEVIRVVYEDKSYAWLGGSDEEYFDGPWAWGDACFVGGYRYAPDTNGERFTERLMLMVEDPGDLDLVAAKLAEIARELFKLEFTEWA